MLNALELNTRRLREKLTQADFAEKLGISRSYLAEIERGRRQVTDDLERRYDRLYAKRLTSVTCSRGVACPHCTGARLELLNDPTDELDKIYRCQDCGHYFTVGQAWNLHYRG